MKKDINYIIICYYKDGTNCVYLEKDDKNKCLEKLLVLRKHSKFTKYEMYEKIKT